jgi:hypothetical protein
MRILIGAPVRQDHQTFYKYLKGLNQLNLDGHKVDYFFILHNSPRLKRFLKPNQYIEYTSENEYFKDENTHHWSNHNLIDVIKMKNGLLKYTIENNYDYFFLVDSDIILKPETLKTLVDHNKYICAELFWTAWNIGDEEMPNAWNADFYSFNSSSEYAKWRNKGLYKVGMSGACILIHRKVIESGVNYTPIENVSFSLWEDRAFCIRANVHGYDVWLDSTCPPQHLYRPNNKPSHNKKKVSHETK